MKLKEINIAVIGQGYVGLPLAIEFGKNWPVTGFDINKKRIEGIEIKEAIEQSGVARFRPIILTSLTTFAGLLPILFETSLQAQFLIPMAISLSFGVLFATFITLLLVPAFYTMVNDLLTFFNNDSDQT